MTLNLSGSSALIRPNIQERTVDLVSRPTDLLDLLIRLGLTTPNDGSQPIKWNVVEAGNGSATLYNENDAPPVPGQRTYGQASLAPFYATTTASVTGHVRDQILRGGTFEDLWEDQLKDATRALFYLVEQTLLGSAQDKGISAIVDDTATYAGLAPGSVPAWAAYVLGSVGTLDVAHLQTMYKNLTDQPHNAVPGLITLGPNQLNNYGNTAGPAATTPLLRYAPPMSTGQPYDMGVLAPGMAFNGVPMERIRNHSTTEIDWWELVQGNDGGKPFELVVHRDLTVRMLGTTNDNDEAQLTFACMLKVHNRRRHGRMTGVTA